MAEHEAKSAVRQRVWEVLAATRAGRGKIIDSIPDFVGSEVAAAHLAELAEWQAARTIMANPDRAQQPVRALALLGGKLLFMAVPGLALNDPFYRLDPVALGTEAGRAADRRVAAQLAPTVPVSEVTPIDIVVCGSVAVNHDGVRIGKGAGYSDREVALLAEAGLLKSGTTFVTTVHVRQVLDEVLPREQHDFLVGYVVTPEGTIRTTAPSSRA
jgi:5-formyltetrahydrofolate cyclo-ligase